jgi:hypothetical protein
METKNLKILGGKPNGILNLEKAVGMTSAAYHGALHLGPDADFPRFLPEFGSRTPIAPHDTPHQKPFLQRVTS